MKQDWETLWKNPWAQAGILLLLLIIYIWTRQVLVGVLIALLIFFIVALEIRQGAKERGWRHEAIDTLKALAIALVLWFGAGWVLNTSAPLSAVASCSMLPNLDRGDFVVVQGAPLQAPEITLTAEEFQALQGEAVIHYRTQEQSVRGSIFSYCRVFNDDVCNEWRNRPEEVLESRGPLTFHYTTCRIEQTGESTACVESLDYDGRNYPIRSSNDILVYAPGSGDYFARIGDIVHRTYIILNVEGDRYYLTKGDNNPLLDIQIFDYFLNEGNAPVAEGQTKGKVIARIPWLGYFKLFIAGLFVEDSQCSQQLVYP